VESISVKTGKKFTGKFASTAVRLGLATPSGDEEESDLIEVTTAPKKKGRKPKK
jgi:hypothetical protein